MIKKYFIKHFILYAHILFLSSSCESLRQYPPAISQGGRATAITVHPEDDKIIIVAAETGGLFKSATNRRNIWQPLYGLPVFRIRDVKFAPSDPDVLIVAALVDFSVTNGGGIWRSTDGGKTWAQPPSAIPASSARCSGRISAYSISFEPGTNVVYVATDCGLLKSADLGATWGEPLTPAIARVNSKKDQDAVGSVLATHPNTVHIVAKNKKVYYSTTGGETWEVPEIQPEVKQLGNHAFAASPYNKSHLFFTGGRTFIYQSINGGRSWTALLDTDHGPNRPPFVKTSFSTSGNPDEFDLWFGNGIKLRKRTFRNESTSITPVGDDWLIDNSGGGLNTDHADPSDIAFNNEQTEPILLVTDGGIHTTADKGFTWRLIGKKSVGYYALQITEVRGQRIESEGKTYHYFATQDNNIWADDGSYTWEKSIGAEGFYLQMQRIVSDETKAKIHGSVVGNGRYPNSFFIAEPMLRNGLDWPPPGDSENSKPPTFIKYNHYVQFTNIDGKWRLWHTTTGGADWRPVFDMEYEPVHIASISGTELNPVLFFPIKMPGELPGGYEIYKLLKISNVLGPGALFTEIIEGYQGLGIFSTAFAKYEVHAVNPHNPNHIIIIDAGAPKILATTTGGSEWREDVALTELVTQGGSIKLTEELNGERHKIKSQISAISFNPDCPNHLLVGTVHAGIFKSLDAGTTWEKVERSERVTNISSFFFDFNDEVVVSTYGRGLWKMKMEGCGELSATAVAEPTSGGDGDLYSPETQMPLLTVNQPYITILTRLIGESLTYPNDTITICGINFLNDYPITVYVDDEIIFQNIRTDSLGKFEVKLLTDYPPGTYRVEAVQKGPNSELRDINSFIVILSDFEEGSSMRQ